MALLKVDNLGISFGGLRAVDKLFFEINEKEIVGLIGPNGAGKTTAFNLLTQVYKPTDGEIIFNGKSIIGQKTYKVNQLGIARTFQNIRLFRDLTALENVKIAMNHKMKYSVVSGMLRLPAYWKEEEESTQKALEILKVFDLDSHAYDKAKNLPYGQQRKLEISRALASNPKLLLLDEPAAGMNPTETDDLMKTIYKIRDLFNISILLIEHDMNLVMGICEKIIVLDYGRILTVGTADEVRNNPRVIAAYLGEE